MAPVRRQVDAGLRRIELRKFVPRCCRSHASDIGMLRYIGALAGLVLSAASSLAHAQTIWHWANPLPQGNTLRGVAWHAGEFVAVGENGTIITSADGIGWALQTSTTRNTL